VNPTAYNDINRLLADLLGRMRQSLDAKLAGLYLYGSLVWGDFDPGISDIDLLALTDGDLNREEFERLDRMHRAFLQDYPRWDDRLEIAYYSVKSLQTFKTARSPIAVISPGEPFNLKDAGYDWLINWYMVQEKGRKLYGPDFKTLIEPISQAEFVAWVRVQVEEWRDYVVHTRDSRPYQGYTILTMCRALRAVETGEQVSKKAAARWAQARFPEKAGIIQKALDWREDYHNQAKASDPAATYPEAVNFVEFTADFIKKK
jgi:predicted nucleotidyltransferase